MSSTKISYDELARHNTANDLFIAVNGTVYDVTSYVSDHPGGDRILLAAGGSDATEAFEDVGHSDDAIEAMEEMRVGALKGWVAPDSVLSFVSEVVSRDTLSEDGDRDPAIALARYAFGALASALILWIFASPSSSPFLQWLGMENAVLSSFSLQIGLMAIIGSGSLYALTLARRLQTLVSTHPELGDFPVLIDNRSERKVVGALSKSAPALDQQRYRPLKLTQKRQVGKNAWKLRLAFPDQSSRSGLGAGQHVSLRASIAGKTVTRSYTPTSKLTETGSIELTVKVYENGAMGNYLKDAALGSHVDVRGPQGRFHYRRNMSENIVCIAGGSGITPMFQIIQQSCLDEKDESNILLLYASRSEDDIILKDELDDLQKMAPSRVEITHLLSQPGGDGASPAPARLSHSYLAETLGRFGPSTMFLICGPDGMVDLVREGLTKMRGHSANDAVSGADEIHVF